MNLLDTAPAPSRHTPRRRRASCLYRMELAALLAEVSERLAAMDDMQEFTPAEKVEWLRLHRMEARLADELKR